MHEDLCRSRGRPEKYLKNEGVFFYGAAYDSMQRKMLASDGHNMGYMGHFYNLLHIKIR